MIGQNSVRAASAVTALSDLIRHAPDLADAHDGEMSTERQRSKD